MIVKINLNGYLESPYIKDAEIPVKVSNNVYAQLLSCPIAKAWKWNFTTREFELVPQENVSALRTLRELECFPIINRGQGWYRMLTQSQLEELDVWYQAWLDVTETRIIPEKPEWLD